MAFNRCTPRAAASRRPRVATSRRPRHGSRARRALAALVSLGVASGVVAGGARVAGGRGGLTGLVHGRPGRAVRRADQASRHPQGGHEASAPSSLRGGRRCGRTSSTCHGRCPRGRPCPCWSPSTEALVRAPSSSSTPASTGWPRRTVHRGLSERDPDRHPAPTGSSGTVAGAARSPRRVRKRQRRRVHLGPDHEIRRSVPHRTNRSSSPVTPTGPCSLSGWRARSRQGRGDRGPSGRPGSRPV